MKYKFIDPDQILSVILALVILAVGIFATFVVFANIPVTTPVGSNARTGSGTITNAVHLTTNATTRWIPTPGYLNNTAVCTFYGLTAGATPHWYLIQTVGAVNGTFIAGNSTYRFTSFPHLSNSSYRIDYPISGQQTTNLQNATYNAILNGSATSTSVFNIIGVVMIIAAIMSIIGLVYTYIRPRV